MATLIQEIEQFAGSSNGQLLAGTVEGIITEDVKQQVDADIVTYFTQSPNVLQAKAVAVLVGREFHAARVKLGFFGFLVDIYANDSRVVSNVTAFVVAEIQGDIATGVLMQNPTTGTIALAPKQAVNFNSAGGPNSGESA